MDNERLLVEMESMLDRKLKSELSPIRQDIRELRCDVGELKEDVSELKKDVSELKEDVSILKEDMRETKKRVTNIELTLENETNHQIRLIAEGHLDLNRHLRESLKVTDERELLLIRVSSLENDVRKIKQAVFAPA